MMYMIDPEHFLFVSLATDRQTDGQTDGRYNPMVGCTDLISLPRINAGTFREEKRQKKTEKKPTKEKMEGGQPGKASPQNLGGGRSGGPSPPLRLAVSPAARLPVSLLTFTSFSSFRLLSPLRPHASPEQQTTPSRRPAPPSPPPPLGGVLIAARGAPRNTISLSKNNRKVPSHHRL
jgi:hypothetical protein